MLKMRLQRTGRKNDASFRVVVTDSRRGPKAGKHVAILGSYNPKMNRFEIDGDAAKDWIAKGVQLSDTVRNLLISQGTIEGRKVNVLPKKSPIIDEEKLKAEAEAKAAAEAEAAAAKEAEEKAEEEAPADDASADEAEEKAPEAEESAEESSDEKEEEKPAE